MTVGVSFLYEVKVFSLSSIDLQVLITLSDDSTTSEILSIQQEFTPRHMNLYSASFGHVPDAEVRRITFKATNSAGFSSLFSPRLVMCDCKHEGYCVTSVNQVSLTSYNNYMYS